MNKYIFKMECITNMHVGSGETNYNIIDNEVQKDVVLQDVPAIHSSGVKGALREHFNELKNHGKINIDIDKIFGKSDGDTTQGTYRFFGAKLIARPLRVSNGTTPYLLTTSEDILEDFSIYLNGLGLSDFFKYKKLNIESDKLWGTLKTELEGIEVLNKIDLLKESEISKLIGDTYVVADTLQNFDLPIIARNNIDNKNLWYEEVVPHKSIFYFAVMTPYNEPIELTFDENTPVQFGGNASIGQGYTKITQIYASLDKNNTVVNNNE